MRLRAVLVAFAAAVVATLAAGANGASPPPPPPVTDVKLGPVAHQTTDKKAIWLPVQFQCAVGQIFSLKALVYQADGGALSPGDYQATCTGKLQRGAFKVTPKGKKPRLYKEGYARACWMRTLKKISAYTDLESTCNGLTIAKPS